jgi:prepilin-type N-terminal cleavage/methylation domain-containing protein
MPHPPFPRAGFTMIELVIVLAIAGLATAVGVRQAHHWLDRLATRAAVREAALVVTRARGAALAQHALVTLRIDTGSATLTLSARGERLATHALGHQHGVHLATTRDSISFDVRGLGYGAANLSLIARRGAAADTLVVSRLGRTRF